MKRRHGEVEIPILTDAELARATAIILALMRAGYLHWSLPPRSLTFLFLPTQPGPERAPA